MQDAPIHCPADVDATEAEKAACETPKPVKPSKPDDGTATPLSGGHGPRPTEDQQRSGGHGPRPTDN